MYSAWGRRLRENHEASMRKMSSAVVFLAALVVVAAGSIPAAAAPVRLARHPDYHAGKVAFSYLGDIWVANEDGSNVMRLTVHRARDIYPHFSPDGKWIDFSSNRYG